MGMGCIPNRRRFQGLVLTQTVSVVGALCFVKDFNLMFVGIGQNRGCLFFKVLLVHYVKPKYIFYANLVKISAVWFDSSACHGYTTVEGRGAKWIFPVKTQNRIFTISILALYLWKVKRIVFIYVNKYSQRVNN